MSARTESRPAWASRFRLMAKRYALPRAREQRSMADTAYIPRLRAEYDKSIRGKLTEQFGYANVMQVPRLEKGRDRGWRTDADRRPEGDRDLFADRDRDLQAA